MAPTARRAATGLLRRQNQQREIEKQVMRLATALTVLLWACGHAGDTPDSGPEPIQPRLTNAWVVERALARHYPRNLRSAGVGGTVVVHMYVTDAGLVEKTAIQASSGHRELDAAALQVAALYRFEPARVDGENVPVWIRVPVTFSVP